MHVALSLTMDNLSPWLNKHTCLLKTDKFINYKYFAMMGFKINQALPNEKSFHCAGVELGRF